MSLAQFLQILAAGRWRLLLCIAACIAGAMAFALRLPPTYEARARVILELVSPDLVTGTEVAAKSTDSYIRTQQLLVTSDRVALRVVEQLGWAENQAVIDAWAATTGGEGDVRTWAARRIMSETAAVPLEGGGTLEIIYRAPEVDAARLIAGMIREAYIRTALELQTEGAARRATRYDELAVAARARVRTAEAAYTALQRTSGTVIDALGNDVESGALERLQQRALDAGVQSLGGGDVRAPSSMTVAVLREQLIAFDQAIALALNQLGPANPQYQSLLARRDSARAALARAQSAAPPSGVAAGRAMAIQAEQAYRDERQRMLARSPLALELARARRQVMVERAELRRLMTTGATVRMQSERTESGLVIMGDVIADDDPVAPNIPVIATLAGLFGIGLGFVAVMIDGLWRREVLSSADLVSATGVPVLGVVPSVRGDRPSLWRWRPSLPRWLARRRGLTPSPS